MKKPRGVIIAGNWKMNHGLVETAEFFAALARAQAKGFPGGTALLFPPMLSLARARELAGDLSSSGSLPVGIGAQNAHWEKKGAFTGEISGPMVRELGLDWILIGHSERRQYFGETDETVRKRTESLLAQGFKVMMCLGETRAEREGGRTAEVLTRQLQGAIPEAEKGAAAYLDGRLVIAYEPVWAIGTGLTATPAQAQEAHALLRGLLAERFGESAAARTPILYGGSVTPENIDSLLACPDVDGGLVGGASLKPESFLSLLASAGRLLSSR